MAENRQFWRIEDGVLALILLAFVGWMLSLPCFPSTDGPVHMYYAHILSGLLFQGRSAYTTYFHIRHLLPPYSLYYYALVALSRWVPMPVADKLIICAYLILFVLGFRYLAHAIGPAGGLSSLFATLLLLNWSLGMGFLSFLLSLSISLWATGLWLRLMGLPSPLRRAGFLCLGTVVMLTHPVPLLLLLLLTGTLLAVRLLQTCKRSGRFVWPACGKADLFTWTALSLNLIYIRRFSTPHPFDQEQPFVPEQYFGDVLRHLSLYGREHALSFFLGRGPDILVYRLGLLAILFVSFGCALWQFVQNRRMHRWTNGDSLLVLGLSSVVILPFFPTELNQCYYFPDRLLGCLWLVFLLSASAWSPRFLEGRAAPVLELSRVRLTYRNVLCACCVSTLFADGMLLYAADRLLRPVAVEVAALESAPNGGPGKIGFVFEDARPAHDDRHETLAWNPYYWALVNVFRRNDDILANAPWIDESIIPVAPSGPLPEMAITALQQPVPSLLQRDLLRSPADLHKTLAVSTFYLVNQVDRPLAKEEPLLRAGGQAALSWRCSSQGWYRACRAPDFTVLDQQIFSTKASLHPLPSRTTGLVTLP